MILRVTLLRIKSAIAAPVWLAALLLAIAGGTPSLAQTACTFSRHTTPHPYQLKDIGRPYSMRVTVGAHRTSGWEHSLTNADPNLRHWTWLPITDYDQAILSADRRQPKIVRPSHVYVKPNHIPLPVVDHGAPQVPASPPSVEDTQRGFKAERPDLDHTHNYLKPNHVPAPVVAREPSFAVDDVFGKLNQPHSHVQPAAAHAKTYGPYSDVSGHMAPAKNYDANAVTRVRGKLLSSVKSKQN